MGHDTHYDTLRLNIFAQLVRQSRNPSTLNTTLNDSVYKFIEYHMCKFSFWFDGKAQIESYSL